MSSGKPKLTKIAACDACHDRKVKCNLGEISAPPCENCLVSGNQCSILRPRRRGGRNSLIFKSEPPSNANANKCTAEIEPTLFQTGRKRLRNNKDVDVLSNKTKDNSYALPPFTEIASSDFTAKVNNVLNKTVEPNLNSRSSESTSDRLAVRTLLASDDDVESLVQAREHLIDFFGQSLQEPKWRNRIKYSGTLDSNIAHLIKQHLHSSFIHHFPQAEFSSYPRPRPKRKADRDMLSDASLLPSSDICDRLVDDYFKYVHPGFPVIWRKEFMEQYKNPAMRPPLILLQSIFLVGAHVTKLPSIAKVRRQFKVATFRRAKALFDQRIETNRLTLVQAALLLTWHSQNTDDASANDTYWSGLACSIAFGLGVHRDSRYSQMTEFDKKLYKRVWWMVFITNVISSFIHGRPPLIRREEVDIEKLEISDYEGDETDYSQEYNVAYIRDMVSLCEIILHMRDVFAPAVSPEKKAKRFSEVDAMLSQWSIQRLQANSNPTAKTVSLQQTFDYWSGVLYYTYHHVVLVLHRSREDSQTSQAISSQASASLIALFADFEQKDAIRFCWFGATNALFAALIQISAPLQSKSASVMVSSLYSLKSALPALRRLSEDWLYASSILALFENSSHESLKRAEFALTGELNCQTKGSQNPNYPSTTTTTTTTTTTNTTTTNTTIDKETELGNSNEMGCDRSGEVVAASSSGDTFHPDFYNNFYAQLVGEFDPINWPEDGDWLDQNGVHFGIQM